MTATAAKPKETWRDWTAPNTLTSFDDLVTRPELIARLTEEGVEVAEKDFIYWQREGVLPYPVKIRHDNATWAFYPVWITHLVKDLIRLRAEGIPLGEVRTRLKDRAHQLTVNHQVVATLVDRTEDLRPAAEEVARIGESVTGKKIATVRLQLFDESGERSTFTFDVS